MFKSALLEMSHQALVKLAHGCFTVLSIKLLQLIHNPAVGVLANRNVDCISPVLRSLL